MGAAAPHPGQGRCTTGAVARTGWHGTGFVASRGRRGIVHWPARGSSALAACGFEVPSAGRKGIINRTNPPAIVTPGLVASVKSDNACWPGGCSWRKISSGPCTARHSLIPSAGRRGIVHWPARGSSALAACGFEVPSAGRKGIVQSIAQVRRQLSRHCAGLHLGHRPRNRQQQNGFDGQNVLQRGVPSPNNRSIIRRSADQACASLAGRPRASV
jgi:hypothetical protein